MLYLIQMFVNNTKGFKNSNYWRETRFTFKKSNSMDLQVDLHLVVDTLKQVVSLIQKPFYLPGAVDGGGIGFEGWAT